MLVMLVAYKYVIFSMCLSKLHTEVTFNPSWPEATLSILLCIASHHFTCSFIIVVHCCIDMILTKMQHLPNIHLFCEICT